MSALVHSAWMQAVPPALRHAAGELAGRLDSAWKRQRHRWRQQHPRAAAWLPQGAAMLAVALLVCGIGWMLPYRSAQSDLQRLRLREMALKQAYLQRLPQAPRPGAAERRKLLAERYLAQWQQQLAGNEEQDAVMNEIDSAGVARGLRFTLFKPESDAATAHDRIAIRLQAVGSYRAIARFVADLERLPRIVVLDPLTLQGKDSGHGGADGLLTLSATASAYRKDAAQTAASAGEDEDERQGDDNGVE